MEGNVSTRAEISTVSADISKRIQAIRYIGIVGVTMCHAVQMPYFIIPEEFPEFNLADFTMDGWIATTHSVVIYGFFYGAVTMFYLFSGYLHMSKSRGYWDTVLRRMQSLLVPMALWSAISIALLHLQNEVLGVPYRADLLSCRDPLTWFEALVGDYSEPFVRGTHCPTFMFQFWFIRDLFVLTLLSPALD
ncbi:MAG: hypothetical protein MJ025_07170, partial [Victivallaceae bacterium]|nr:hypothetical protein [Victivallaceae bacterium]